MAKPDFDVVIIGAGVVGLAIGRATALSGFTTLIVEQADTFGTETSSRNSEVIHAGIYYPSGSLKARLCLEGKTQLYAFCDTYSVPYSKCGKLIVATDLSQATELESMKTAAEDCGVFDLRILEAPDVRRVEPDVACAAAILSPSTGIVDTHALMQTLVGVADANGALLIYNTRVTGLLPTIDGWSIFIEGSEKPVVTTRNVVNAAGLGACPLAEKIEGFPCGKIPRLHLAKGSYFHYGLPTTFQHLVYPVPEPGGLGTHLTLDMAGRARFGPDVEWVTSIDYSVDPSRQKGFIDAIRRFWPRVNPEHLHPDYAGIRPKLSGPGEPPADFLIQGPGEHGIPGIINLFGIESPGITASLAIGDYVSNQVALNA